MRKFLLILNDFKYFTLIMLLLLAIVISWIPLMFLGIFLKDKAKRGFVWLFSKFD